MRSCKSFQKIIFSKKSKCISSSQLPVVHCHSLKLLGIEGTLKKNHFLRSIPWKEILTLRFLGNCLMRTVLRPVRDDRSKITLKVICGSVLQSQMLASILLVNTGPSEFFWFRFKCPFSTHETPTSTPHPELGLPRVQRDGGQGHPKEVWSWELSATNTCSSCGNEGPLTKDPTSITHLTLPRTTA